jgi:hypothetical protein
MGSVTLIVGNGGPQVLTSDCATDTWNPDDTTTALGYFAEGGPPPGFSQLALYGCATTAPNSLGISVQNQGVTTTGTFTNGTASYTDAQSKVWSSTSAYKLVVTQVDATGGVIEAQLTASVVSPPSQIAQSVSATFKVCHIQDELAP